MPYPPATLTGAGWVVDPISNYKGLRYGRFYNDGTIASGSNVVGSASNSFTQADVGSLYCVYSFASNTTLYTGTITAVAANGSTATINSPQGNAPATGANATFFVGPDNAATLQALLTAADNQVSAENGLVTLLGGVLMLSTGITVPDGVTLRGATSGSAFSYDAIARGTTLVAAGNSTFPTTYVVKVGVNNAASIVMGARLENCNVWGGNFVTNGIYHHGWEAVVQFCRSAGCVNSALFTDNNVGRIVNNHLSMGKRGYCLDASNIKDVYIRDNYLNGAAGTVGSPTAIARFVYTTGGGDIRFYDNHLWQESPLSVNFPANGVLIDVQATGLCAGFRVRGNTFDSIYGHGVVTQVASGGQVYGHSVKDNHFLINDVNFPNATFDACRLSTVAGALVVGHTFNGNDSANISGNNSYTNAFNPTGGGTIANISATGNAMRNCNTFTPASTKLDGGNYNNSISDSTAAVKYTSNRGRSTQSGNGATVAFTIAHGLSDTPQTWSVAPRVALAAPAFIVTADATNLTVTYATAPPAVASNVDLQWSANL